MRTVAQLNVVSGYGKIDLTIGMISRLVEAQRGLNPINVVIVVPMDCVVKMYYAEMTELQKQLMVVTSIERVDNVVMQRVIRDAHLVVLDEIRGPSLDEFNLLFHEENIDLMVIDTIQDGEQP